MFADTIAKEYISSVKRTYLEYIEIVCLNENSYARISKPFFIRYYRVT